MAFSVEPTETFELIVVGGGHAGCEAAITAARLGISTALFSLNIDRIAWQPCNPAVGGPAKSQLVHEVDALGGVIGRLADATALQKRVLNAQPAAPAVWALRAQTDKRQNNRKKLAHPARSLERQYDVGNLLAVSRLLHISDLTAPTIGNAGRGDLVICNFILARHIFRANIAGHQKFAHLEIHPHFLPTHDLQHAVG